MLNAMDTFSLYVHFPWCIRKCPYCDFNSHVFSGDVLPEKQYVDTLINELESHLPRVSGRTLQSVFLGGGTPSLFSPEALSPLFEALHRWFSFENQPEVTLEANPGATDQSKFQGYHQLGINRLSVGVQSFQEAHLKRLGRIHDGRAAHRALEAAWAAGFRNINVDLMHGLPGQTVDEALEDLRQAVSYPVTHLSWYQLTLEPNTVFYRHPPQLPSEPILEAIQEAGLSFLQAHGFAHYEISAFCQPDRWSRHNVAYWTFDDYLGIGAGAHSKITDIQQGVMYRMENIKQPQHYLNPSHASRTQIREVPVEEWPFEFMLNRLRLNRPISLDEWTQKTGLPFTYLEPYVQRAQARELMSLTPEGWALTDLGHRFYNDVVQIFMVK